MVDVAQLVEPRIVIPVVAGSIPVVHPIKRVDNQCLTGLDGKHWRFRPVVLQTHLDLAATQLNLTTLMLTDAPASNSNVCRSATSVGKYRKYSFRSIGAF
jgi:hypothetical protein